MRAVVKFFKNHKYLTIIFTVLFLLIVLKLILMAVYLPNGKTINSDKEDFLQRRAYLIDQLESGNFAVSAMPEVGELFQCEWALVTSSMTAAALANIAFRYPETREKSLKHIEKIISVVQQKDYRNIGVITWGNDPLDKIDTKDAQIWYLAHLGIILGAYKYCGGGGKYDRLYHDISTAMIRALDSSSIPYLYTYPGEMYSADNSVMYASLALYYRFYGKDFSSYVNRWVTYTNSHVLDKKTGIVKSYIVNHGGARFNSRGSWVGFMSFYLPMVDFSFAEDQYTKAEKHFFDKTCGLTVCREFPHGVEATGDIDSGPVIFGASPSGTGFIIGGATWHKDYDNLGKFLFTAEFIGTSISLFGKRRYLFSPLVGDAILLAMKSAVHWDHRFVSTHK